MTAARTLFKFRPKDVIADLEPADVPPEYYTDALNINWRREHAERVRGYLQLWAEATQNPAHLVEAAQPNVPYWLYASTSNNIWVTDGTNHFDVTPTPAPTAPIDDPWTSTNLNGVAVINDATTPWYWDGNTSNPLQILPGWQSGHTTRCIRSYKNFLLALSYDDGVGFDPELLVWSDSADPGAIPQEWLPTASNNAGFISVADEPGLLLDGAVLRDQFILYKNNSVWTLNFTGGNEIFTLRSLYRNVGILARNCVVSVRGLHYFLADNDILAHDGQSITSLLDRRWRRTFFGALNRDEQEKSFVLHHEPAREVWFLIPSNGATYPNIALIYNYESGQLGYREIDEVAHGANGLVSRGTGGQATTWDQLTGTWDENTIPWDQLGGGADTESRTILAVPAGSSEFFWVDAADDLDGRAIDATLRRHSMDFGETDRVKTVRRVWPRVTSAGGTFEIRIGSQMDPYAPIEWQAWVPFDQSDMLVDTFASGRYISMEMRSQGGGSWRSSGADIEFEFRGRY